MTLSKPQFEEAKDISQFLMEQPTSQDSDVRGMLKELNIDELERDSGLSSIDTRTNLEVIEVSSHTTHDGMVNLHALPVLCLMTTRQMKRLSVSKQGKGRDQMVDMTKNERSFRRNWLGRMMGQGQE